MKQLVFVLLTATTIMAGMAVASSINIHASAPQVAVDKWPGNGV